MRIKLLLATLLATLLAISSAQPNGLACCSLHPASFSATKGFASEARMNGKVIHLLGYQNVPVNKSTTPGGNAMLLPIPAKPGTMTQKNIFDTSKADTVLNDMASALDRPFDGQPSWRGLALSSNAGPIVFDSDIYTIVLAGDAADIPEALSKVPKSKRPALNKQIFDAYAKWYPGWTFALCCFDNKDAGNAKPMIWWYEPRDQTRLFFPALDEHDGKVPDLEEQVQVDHALMFSVPELKRTNAHRVIYSKPLPAQLAPVLPKNVLGTQFYGKMVQGDFSVNLAELRKGKCPIERVLPPGTHAHSWGLAYDVFKQETPGSLPPGSQSAKGDIEPYRKELMLRIGKSFPTSKLQQMAGMIVTAVTLRGGTILDTVVETSSGDKKLDEEAVDTIKKIQLGPWPEWVKGDSLRVKVQFTDVVAVMKSKKK